MIWHRNTYVCILPVMLRHSPLQLPSQLIIPFQLVMMGTYTSQYQYINLGDLSHYEFECMAVLATYFIGVGMLTHPANSDFGVALWWLVAGLALSLITNALIVCLTAGKVWWISWNNRLCPVAVRYKAVVWTILESGAVYGVVMVFLVVFTAMDTQVGSFISNIFVQLCVSPVFKEHF